MIQIDINMPIGCIYEGDNGKTEYCPLCNHDDVPYCQYLDDNEAALGIDERPYYCPLYKPEPHWIPCSERLPEEDNVEVLCTVKQQSKTDRSETIIVEQGCYFYGTWLLSYDNQRVNCIREVLAWMPLPEPYQPKEDES